MTGWLSKKPIFTIFPYFFMKKLVNLGISSETTTAQARLAPILDLSASLSPVSEASGQVARHLGIFQCSGNCAEPPWAEPPLAEPPYAEKPWAEKPCAEPPCAKPLCAQ